MLKCRDVLEIGSAYVDAGLTRSDVWNVRMHLLICGNCRAYIQKLRLTIHTAGELESHAPSERQVEDILMKVLGNQRPES